MIPRVRPSPTRVSINILYTQLDNTLTFYTRRACLSVLSKEEKKVHIFYLGAFPHSLLLLLSIQLYLIIVKQRTVI